GHGFCLFNNIAIAAQHAVRQNKRVLILDFDGHLGDGTMDIFYHTDQVLYWSIHQYPGYPGNGSAREIGEGKGKGFTINTPLPARSGDDILLHAIEYMLPAAIQFEPDVVGLSAGFDAHMHDPMLQLHATGNFYYKLGLIMQEHFNDKLFAVLEGGYNTNDLPACIHNFLAGINNQAMPFPGPSSTSEMSVWGTYEMHLHHSAALLAEFWKF
ncbi:MAG: histone deacetylase family protein, partial [Saprospiraceae bacterium]